LALDAARDLLRTMSELEQALVTVVRGLERMVRVAIREELANAQQAPSHRDVAWMTEAGVAQSLGISKVTLYSWRAQAKGPRFTKIGRLVRYRSSDVDAWLEEQRTGRMQTPTSKRSRYRGAS
jgi:excisionase family DNA binding protein